MSVGLGPMKNIDIKSLIIGALLTSTIFFGVAGVGAPGGGFVGPAGGGAGGRGFAVPGLPAGVDPVTGLPLGGGGYPAYGGGLPGLPVGGGGAAVGGGMAFDGGGMSWNPNQAWEVKSYVAIAGKPQPDWLTKGLIVQGHEPFAVDERGNIMFRRRVR